MRIICFPTTILELKNQDDLRPIRSKSDKRREGGVTTRGRSFRGRTHIEGRNKREIKESRLKAESPEREKERQTSKRQMKRKIAVRKDLKTRGVEAYENA